VEGGVEVPSRGMEEETWTWEVPRWASWRRRAVLAAEGRSNVMIAFCFSIHQSQRLVKTLKEGKRIGSGGGGIPPSGSNVKDWILPQKEKKSVTCFSVTVLSTHCDK
jgi:hypothetical protein